MSDKKKQTKQESVEKEEVKKEQKESLNEQIDYDALTKEQAVESLKKSVEKIEELANLLKKSNDEIAVLKNDYLRARADCENVRKHKAEDVRSAYDDGKLEAVKVVLNIGDSLDWALKIPMEEKTREGIEMLLKKYHASLENLGVKEFSPNVNDKFDPNVANAVMQVEKENENEESDTIKQVFGRGYKLNDKVIRYASVSVIK